MNGSKSLRLTRIGLVPVNLFSQFSGKKYSGLLITGNYFGSDNWIEYNKLYRQYEKEGALHPLTVIIGQDFNQDLDNSFIVKGSYSSYPKGVNVTDVYDDKYVIFNNDGSAFEYDNYDDYIEDFKYFQSNGSIPKNILPVDKISVYTPVSKMYGYMYGKEGSTKSPKEFDDYDEYIREFNTDKANGMARGVLAPRHPYDMVGGEKYTIVTEDGAFFAFENYDEYLENFNYYQRKGLISRNSFPQRRIGSSSVATPAQEYRSKKYTYMFGPEGRAELLKGFDNYDEYTRAFEKDKKSGMARGVVAPMHPDDYYRASRTRPMDDEESTVFARLATAPTRTTAPTSSNTTYSFDIPSQSIVSEAVLSTISSPVPEPLSFSGKRYKLVNGDSIVYYRSYNSYQKNWKLADPNTRGTLLSE